MVVYTVANVWLSNRHTKLREKVLEAEKETGSIQSDSINNHQTVKYFAAEKHESERYGKYVDELKNRDFAADVYGLKMTFSQRSIIDVFTSIATLLAAYAAFSGNDFTAGDFILFTTYLVQLYNPFYNLGYAYREFKKALVDMKQMFEFLDEEVEQDDEDAQDLPENQCSITFNKVKFGYGEEKLILDEVDFTINAGETVALVGPSGSGKSTIYRLLLRFFEVQEGSIEICGLNIRKISRKSLRKHFGIVSQDIELFNDTIEYNIRYGDIEASQEQVEEASKAAAIHDFIISHSDGYNTQVGQKGIKLSGGEKQRVSIARAILKKPQYILLDEATSALDNQTEKAIQDNLNELCKSRTSLIIAHRLTTVTHADRIFVLEKGKIVESGNHKELLEMKGVYYDMWEQHNK
uniref:Uncharacterized protein n=1 Tax=Acrobeloides nanus TaxID=290746 RepID=A0A914E248_9BILA